jgi:hypothetical protein
LPFPSLSFYTFDCTWDSQARAIPKLFFPFHFIPQPILLRYKMYRRERPF